MMTACSSVPGHFHPVGSSEILSDLFLGDCPMFNVGTSIMGFITKNLL